MIEVQVKIDSIQVKIIEFRFKLTCYFNLKLQFKLIEIAVPPRLCP